MTRRTGGFTLLELTVVLAIFALMSVMSLQALRGTIRSQTGLETQASANATLARGLTRLRHDLEAAVPLAFTDPQGTAQPALVLAGNGAGFALSVGGQPRETGQGAGLHRVEWAHDPATGVLARRVWLSLIPSQNGTAGPDVIVLQGVDRVEVAAFGPQGNWQPDWVPDPDAGPATLPRALRIRIESRSLGTFDLIERF